MRSAFMFIQLSVTLDEHRLIFSLRVATQKIKEENNIHLTQIKPFIEVIQYYIDHKTSLVLAHKKNEKQKLKLKSYSMLYNQRLTHIQY